MPAVVVLRVRRGWQVAAVDRRTAGGIGDHQPPPEQLRQQLYVGRLSAAGAGAGPASRRGSTVRRPWISTPRH